MYQPDFPVGFGNRAKGANDGGRLIDDPVTSVVQLRQDLFGDELGGGGFTGGLVVILHGLVELASLRGEAESFSEALEDELGVRVLAGGDFLFPGWEAGGYRARLWGGEVAAGVAVRREVRAGFDGGQGRWC